MTELRIAFIPLARTTFDIPFATEMTEIARHSLLQAGLTIVGPEYLVTDLEIATTIAQSLSNSDLDLLVVFQASFADSSMITALAEIISAPIFLWAPPEERTGGRLRLNSLCGINLAGHALTLRDIQYEYNYAAPDDPAVIQQIKTFCTASNVCRRLKKARIGVVGEHPAGMDTCHLDEANLKKIFGIEIIHIELEEIFHRSRNIQQNELTLIRESLESRLSNLMELDQQPLNKSLGVFNSLNQIVIEHQLDGLAVRCWPEFFTELGCAACGAMSMMSDGFNLPTPIPCSCEADINGTVTQLILQWLSNSPAFGTDIVSMDFDADEIAVWHCGLAPLSYADPAVRPRGSIHSNRKVPLVMEFPLKPGNVSIARLSQATGELRLVIGQGEMLSRPSPFSGTAGTMRLQKPARFFFDALMREGLEHHISLVYGDFYSELLSLSKLLQLPVYRI
jgi:L-fucose isomerase-like protein